MDDQTQTAPQTFAGISKDQMSAYRQQYGQDGVKALTVPLPTDATLQVIVRRPSRAEFERFVDAGGKAQASGKASGALIATRNLLLSCVLAPAPEEMGAKLDLYPVLLDKLVAPLMTMVGAEIEVREETF